MKKTLGRFNFNKQITILGTAFKPNTDDIRDSIAIELIKKLSEREQVKIIVHDPKANQKYKELFLKKK